MNIKNSFSLLLALLFVTLVATVQSSSAVVPQKGSHAFGEGQFTFRDDRINFIFDAKGNENARAHGQAHFTFTRFGSQTEVTVRIKCLNAGPSSAGMTGVVQDSNDPDFPKHAPVVFAVLDWDNFPLPTPRPDQITPLFVIPDFLLEDLKCGPLSPLTILDLDFGDIQIEP